MPLQLFSISTYDFSNTTVFRANKDKSTALPLSSSSRVELWRWLQGYPKQLRHSLYSKEVITAQAAQIWWYPLVRSYPGNSGDALWIRFIYSPTVRSWQYCTLMPGRTTQLKCPLSKNHISMRNRKESNKTLPAPETSRACTCNCSKLHGFWCVDSKRPATCRGQRKRGDGAVCCLSIQNF